MPLELKLSLGGARCDLGFPGGVALLQRSTSTGSATAWPLRPGCAERESLFVAEMDLAGGSIRTLLDKARIEAGGMNARLQCFCRDALLVPKRAR